MISPAIAQFVTCTWYRLAMMAITTHTTTTGSINMSIAMKPNIIGSNRMSTRIIAIRIVVVSSVCQKTINSHNIKILQEEPCLKIRFKSS